MTNFSIVDTINLQIENINKQKQEKRELILELAVLKAFIINQELFSEVEEFKNLIFIELDEAGKF